MDMMQNLFDRMDLEQEKYREWLVQQPPETILDHAYEYTVRVDIMMTFADTDFELDQAHVSALLTRKSPLQDILKDYLKLDSDIMTTIQEVAVERADAILESVKETPVYLHTATYATTHGEFDLYRTSKELNLQCRESIEQAISEHYHDNRLDTEAAVSSVTQVYGYDRPQFILAATVRNKLSDGRFDQETKAWAACAPTLDAGGDTDLEYVIDKAHPVLVQAFINTLQVEQARSSLLEEMAPLNGVEYQKLRDEHPGKVAGIIAGGLIMFYGEDVHAVAPVLDTKVLTANIPALGKTAVTGSNLSWQSVLKDLMDNNIPVVLAQQDPEKGTDSPYLVVKERDIPLSVEELAAQIYDLTSKAMPELTQGTDGDEQISLTVECLREGDTQDFIYLLVDISREGKPEFASQAERLLAQVPDPVLEQHQDGPEL